MPFLLSKSFLMMIMNYVYHTLKKYLQFCLSHSITEISVKTAVPPVIADHIPTNAFKSISENGFTDSEICTIILISNDMGSSMFSKNHT